MKITFGDPFESAQRAWDNATDDAPLRRGKHTISVGVLGFDLQVTFDYVPAERAQHYGNAPPYPGAPAVADIVRAVIPGHDIDLVPHLSDEAIESLEEAALDYIAEAA